MTPTDPDPPSIAVIVVPGVGDDEPGDTVRVVADALLRDDDAPFTHAVTDEIVVPAWNPHGPGPQCTDRPSPATRIRVVNATGPDVVLYEMRWADLSRFPSSLMGFVAAFYGLLFQTSTAGLEALRPLTGPTGQRPARLARRVLALLSWLLAVPLLAVTAVLLLMAVALFVTLIFETPREAWLRGFLLVAMATATVGAGFAGGRFLRRQGWGSRNGFGSPVAWGVAIAGGAVVATVVRAIQTRDLQLASSDVLVASVAWAFRPLWLLVGATAIFAVGTLVAVAVVGPSVQRRQRGQVVLTALISIVVSTVGLAVAGAALMAAIGAPMLRSLGPGAWTDHAGVHCLLRTSDWTLLRACERDPNTWATTLFAQALAPIQPAAILIAVLLAVAVLMAGDFITCFVRRWGDPDRWRSALDGSIAYFGGWPHGALLAGATILASLAIGAVWIPIIGSGGVATGVGSIGVLGAGASSVVAGLLVAVRYARGRWLKAPRRALDLPYDIATYLRTPHGRWDDDAAVEPPRRPILRRYAALVRFVGVTEKSPRLVIAAHSQGTMLSLAFLLGDPYRDLGDAEASGAWPASPRAGASNGPSLPPVLELITFGSPARQTYAARFPLQYDQISDTGWVRHRLAEVSTTATWTNLYRSGDYVGRSLWSTLPVDVPFEDVSGGISLRERCIGAGEHTAYWGSPELAAQIRTSAGL